MAIVSLCLLALAGCSSQSAEPGAETFYSEHAAGVRSAVSAAKAAATDLSGLSTPPSPAQLGRLALYARRLRRAVVPAANWSVSEHGEEADVMQAETEVGEGAGYLIKAASALHAYANGPNQASLALYRSQLGRGRELWNNGVIQLWYLAHKAAPPTI